jgi:hypothetical protein
MKTLALAAALLFASSALAGKVRGYTTKNGTYVAPSYRSKPDGLKFNNYSTKGNANPYTGKRGSK